MPSTIHITVKMLGKKQAALNKVPLELPTNFPNNPALKDLLTIVVQQQVQLFNARKTSDNILPYLESADIATQAKRGKVSFGASYNEQTVDENTAIETALQAFEDGLFYIFINDQKIEHLTEAIILTDETSLLFLRLVALTGGYF